MTRALASQQCVGVPCVPQCSTALAPYYSGTMVNDPQTPAPSAASQAPATATGAAADPTADSSSTVPRPPVAPKRPAADPRSFHGDEFFDPWEWLRDKENPEVIAHLNAENAWADVVTAPTRGLAAQLAGEFRAHTVETDTTVPVRAGDFWYYTRTTEGKSYPAHWRVAVESAPTPSTTSPASPLPPTITPGVPLPGEQLLVDEAAQAEGLAFFRLSSLVPSPDGRLIAWGRDLAGDERWTIVIQDAATGDVLDESVTGTGYGLAWSADSSTLLYARVDDAWRQCQAWTHRVGADPSTDTLVLQENDERFDLWFSDGRDPRWVVLQSTSTTTGEAWLWSRERPDTAPVPLTGRTRDVLIEVEAAGDHLVLVHTATSQEGTLAAAALPADLDARLVPLGEAGDRVAPTSASTDPAHTADLDERDLLAPPASWIPLREAAEGERILAAEAFATFLLVSLRSDGLTQIEWRTRATPADLAHAVPAADLATLWGPGRFVEADTPVRTITTASSPRFEDTTFRVEVESIVRPPSVLDVDPATGASHVLKTLEVPGWNPEDFTEERVWVTASDGRIRIPVSLVHRAGATPDGTAPGWISGYGSYEVSNDPEFSVMRLPLLERGVVYAIAHVRGGGELGRAWYEDGKLDRKEHTFTDFVDVARWMVDSGWVAPGRLIAEGRSAGGLLMGAVTNLAPGAFRVVLAGVPFVDALTTILDPSLPLTAGEWEEWGNPIEDPEIYRVMKRYTPYENVRDGVEYPAIFATTSLNDTRVFFVEPTKWIQRLREAVTNDPVERPIAQRTEMVAGHGGKSGRYGRWESRAEEFAFALGQVGALSSPRRGNS